MLRAAFAVLAATILAGLAAASAAGVPQDSGKESAPQLVFADEFAGRAGAPPDPRNWRHETGGFGWGNDELQRYTRRRANSRLDGRGRLAIVARDGRRGYSSARLRTLGRFEFRYGTVAARIRVPAGKGLWPAFWMMGDDIGEVGWPRCTEIDVMEVLGHQPRRGYGTVHGAPVRRGGIGGGFIAEEPLSDGFHVFSVDWSPERIAFAVDGEVYEVLETAELPRGWVFDHRMFMLLNLAVGGDWPGEPNRRTRFPARMLVDWVRVWQ